MKSRIRVVKKIGDGKYYTQSWKVSEYIWVNVLYYIFIWPYIMLIKWCFVWPIKKLVELFKSDKITKENKKKIIIGLVVFLLLTGIIGAFTGEEENNIDDSVKDENSVDVLDEKNPWEENEKYINKFIDEYNNIAEFPITENKKINNHTIAELKFGTKNAKINDNKTLGFLVEMEFTNGKEQVDEYSVIVRDCIKVFNPNLENDIIQNKISEAKNTNNQLIFVDDNITLKYHYVESNVGYKQGDRYMIEIISTNYN